MANGVVKDLFARRVPQAVGIYLGISWAVLEFVGFLVNQYLLSPHLVSLCLVVLVSLIPSVTIVAYFHGAPGRQGWTRVEQVTVPVNFLGLAVLVAVLFTGKDLGAATTTVVVTDEEGVESERVIPKTEFRKRITVYFFDAEPADTAATWLQYGLPVAVLTDLYQDQFINLQTPILFPDRLREAGFEEMVNVPLSLAREIAEEQHREHFVMGSVATVDGEIQATVSLYDARRGRLLEEHTHSGTDVLAMADEISVQLREDLKIPDLGDEGAQDLPVAEMLTGSPSAYRFYTEAVKAFQVDQDFPRAISLLEEAVAEDPTFADAQSTLGALYMINSRTEEAVGPLQAAMDHLYRLPERSRFLVKHNYYYLVREDVDRAWAVLDMWADLIPDDIEAHGARVVLQFINDDKEGALTSLETILELDPGQRDVLLQIGSLQEAMGNFAEARVTFQQYADEFPENHQVLTQLAGLARRDGDLEGARGYYERALLLQPSDVGLTVGMASVERTLGNFDEALAQLEDAQGMATTPGERAQVLSAYESYYRFRGQIGAEIDRMEQRLAEAPSYTPAMLLAQQQIFDASTYATAGRPEEAFSMVEEARGQLPSPFDAVTVLGEMDIYLILEDADAIEATLPGVEYFITSLRAEIHRWRMFYGRGRVHELRGEYQEAIEQYREEQSLNPSDTSIPTQLGRCHRELGEYEEAVSLLQEALKVSPFAPKTNYELALTYEAMGRMEEARTHLERALEVWADADPGYEPAAKAREKSAELTSGS